MKNVHSIALLRPSFEADIVARWIEHYLRFPFATRTVFLHLTGSEHDEPVAALLRRSGWIVRPIVPYHSTILTDIRQQCIDRRLDELKTDDPDCIVHVADSDEFQDMTTGHVDGIRRGEYDILAGHFVDRWNPDGLVEVSADTPLDVQYPASGDFMVWLRGRAPSDLIAAIPPVQRTKIILRPLPVAVSRGSHHLEPAHSSVPRPAVHPDDIDVAHYPFRANYAQRCATKFYYDSRYAALLRHVFHCESIRI